MRQYWNNRPCHNHRQRIGWMTGNNKLIKESFKKVKNWADLHSWHRENTPWLSNDQINLLMKSYHNEAKTKKQISPDQ